MKILMFSGDPQILNALSDAARRMRDYGRIVNRLDIFVLVRYLPDRMAPALVLSPAVSAEATTGRITRFWRAYCRAAYLLKHDRYDLITAQDTEHAGIAWLLSRRFKVPFEMQMHTDIMSPHFRRHSFLNRIRRMVALFLLPRAACVRAVSFRIAHSLAPSIKAVTLPIYVDVKSIRTMPVTFDLHKKYPTYEKIVLAAGRLTREKNFPLAIRAIRRVVKKYPRVLLVIAGSGPEKRAIVRAARRSGVAANIALEGSVPLATLVSYYKTADLYLLTSEYEGYGRTLIEAAAAGCPIVSTDVGAAEEIRGAYVVPVGDKKAVADAVLHQLALPRVAPQLPALPSWGDYLKALKESFERCAHA